MKEYIKQLKKIKTKIIKIVLTLILRECILVSVGKLIKKLRRFNHGRGKNNHRIKRKET